MNIAYDIFINHPELVKEVNKDPEADTFFTELLMFVIDRLKPLEEQINKEESDNPEEAMGTIIHVLRTDGKFLQFFGYTQQLRDKMSGCFSQEDFNFIMQKIENINSTRNN